MTSQRDRLLEALREAGEAGLLGEELGAIAPLHGAHLESLRYEGYVIEERREATKPGRVTTRYTLREGKL